MEYKKIEPQINDFVGDNIKKLAQIFPSAVKDGQVDFTALKEELGQFEEVDSEKYELTWAGKQNAKKIAQEDVYGKTLKFIPEESKNADTTENLYIEGDNLEVLKLLRQNYYGAIKMIYIDPPYNTGNDFIYNDQFTMDRESSELIEGNVDELGERWIANLKSQNRYHAKWLSMMYSRLRVAKDLLSDDGVIYISIDDNEVDNIMKVAKEIFDEQNFINIITVKTKVGGVSGSSEGKSLKDTTEFILVFAKNKNNVTFKPIYLKTKLFDRIKKYEEEGKSWKYTSIITKLKDKVLIKEDFEKNIKYYGYKTLETMSIKAFAQQNDITIEDVYNQYADKIFQTTNAQSSVRQTVIKETKGHEYPMFGCEYVPIKGKNEGKKIEVLYKGEQRRMMMYLSDAVEKVGETYYYLDKVTTLWDDIQYNNLTKEGRVDFPNGKKPIKLLQRLIQMSTDKNSIILDFFSGSASTGHATMQQNVEDGGNRHFILVQLPEQYNGKLEEGFRASTICDLGKERLRRAGDDILVERPNISSDLGFKVFTVQKTNIKWNLLTDIGQTDIFKMQNSPDLVDFMRGTKDSDVVYELMLHQRDIPLSARLELRSDIGSRTYFYANSYLVCLETEVTDELVNKLALLDPLPIKFIFRDSAFKDDIALKDETFRRLKALIEKNSGTSKKAYTVEFI